jgi:hypothetical protein
MKSLRTDAQSLIRYEVLLKLKLDLMKVNEL